MAVSIEGKDYVSPVTPPKAKTTRSDDLEKELSQHLDPRDAMALRGQLKTSSKPAEIPELTQNFKYGNPDRDYLASVLGDDIGKALQKADRQLSIEKVGRYRAFDDPVQQRHNAMFMSDFESAWHASAGKIDPGWFMANAADLHLLGPAFADVAQQVYKTMEIETGLREAEDKAKADQSAQFDWLAETFGLGKVEAMKAMQKYAVAMDQGDQAVANMTPAELAAAGGYTDVDSSNSLIPGEGRISFEDAVAKGTKLVWDKATGEWSDDVLGDVEAFGGGNFHNIMMGRDYSFSGVGAAAFTGGLNTFGTVIGAGLRGVGWVIDQAVGDSFDIDRFQRGYDKLFGSSRSVVRRREEEQALRDSVGRSHESNVWEAASDGLIAGWEATKVYQPEAAQEYIAMFAGTEDPEGYARAAWSEEAVYMGFAIDGVETSIWKEAEAQAEAYESAESYKLKKMEDSNYGWGDAILQVMAGWGELLEYPATILSYGAQQLWYQAGDLAFNPLWKGQGAGWDFKWSGPDGEWQTIKDFDTPAGVFGLEGTPFGLAIDTITLAGVDPTILFMGPRLAASGRAGAISAKQAVQIINSKAAGLARESMVNIIRSSSRSALGKAVVLDVLSQTGLGPRMLGAISGWKSPMLGFWEGMKKWGAVADDVNIMTLADHLPAGNVAPEALEAARARLLSGKYEPVKMIYNPNTGAVGMLSGADEVAAALLYNFDNIKAVWRVDKKFGMAGGEFRPHVPELPGDALPPIENATLHGRLASTNLKTGNIRMDLDAIYTDFEHNMAYLDTGQKAAVFKELGVDLTELKTWIKSNGGETTYERIIASHERYHAANHIGQEVKPGMMHTDNIAMEVEATKAALDEVGYYPQHPDPAIKTRDWDGHAAAERALEIDGVEYVAPRHLLPDEQLHGEAVDMETIKAIELLHIKRGGDPMHKQRTAMSISVGHALSETLAKGGKIGRSFEQWFTPINNSMLLSHVGANGMSNTNQVMARLYGAAQDMDGLEVVTRRVMNWWAEHGQIDRRAMALEAESRALEAKIIGMENTIGGYQYGSRLNLLKDNAEVAGNTAAELARQAEAAVRRRVRELREEARAIEVQQKELWGQRRNYDGLNEIIGESLDDLNRTHIATQDFWKPWVNKKTGMVDWKIISPRSGKPQEIVEAALARAKKENISLMKAAELNLGTDKVPGWLKRVAEASDQATEGVLFRYMEDTMNGAKGASAYSLPAQPLEIMAAMSGGPDLLRTIQAQYRYSKLRDTLHAAHTLWMVDKVMTPRTAIVVSLDELMRGFHTGGAPSMFQYLEDKVMFATNRFKAIENMGATSKLGTRWQKRFTALKEYPDFFKQVQRSVMETHGYGLDVIEFKPGSLHANTDYFAAAQRQAGLSVQEPGWQAFLKGEDAFRDWFKNSTEAQPLRDMDYFSGVHLQRQALPKWEEVYKGYETQMDGFLQNIREGKQGQAFKEWQKAAQRAADNPEGRPIVLPDWVLEGFGTVSGKAKVPQKGIPRGVDWLSEKMFQGPMNYRQGFLAEMVRKSELARLDKLYKSQGIRVIPESEVLAIMQRKYPYLSKEFLTSGMDTVAADLMDNAHVVSQRYVNQLVEGKVVAEMENQLYAFHRQSPAGRVSRAVFPFGKPWADMWGYWGREMLNKPQLRGFINESNFLNIGNIGAAAMEKLPFNVKTAGLVSRLAATDFDLPNVEDDPLFGGVARMLDIDSLDVGGALFLPTGGKSTWQVLLPGLGMLPGIAAEAAIRKYAPDPVKEPEAFQDYMDGFSSIFPGVGYNQPADLAALLSESVIGGGAMSRAYGLYNQLGLMFDSDMAVNSDAITGDWKTGIAYARQIKLEFADPETFAELLELTGVTADVGIEAWINEKLIGTQAEASERVGLQRARETIVEFALPAKVTTLTQSEELQSIWTDAVDYLPFSDEFKRRLDLTTEEGLSESAGLIRDAFYKLSSNDQDMLVGKNPQLAVNMVSMWTWSQSAKDHQVEGSGEAYSSGGSTKDLARHANMLSLGYIRPVTPRELAVRIIGKVATTRSRVASRLYETAVEEINELRWEHEVTPQWKSYFEDMVGALGQTGDAPWDTPQEIWKNWNAFRTIVWQGRGQPMTSDGDKDWEQLPPGMEAWSETRPTEAGGLRSDMQEGFIIPQKDGEISDELKALSAATGIPVDANTEMSALHQGVLDYLAENIYNNAAYVVTAGEYGIYTSGRGEPAARALSNLHTLLQHSGVDENTRFDYTKTLFWLEEAISLKRAGDPSWLAIRDQAAMRFKGMKEDDIMGSLPPGELEFLWDEAYGKDLGALDWTPEEPAPLFGPKGQITHEAERVYPRKVYDGDTLQFSTDFKKRLIGGLFGPTIPADVMSLRLLGVNAREVGEEGGAEDRLLLEDAISDAVDNGQAIYIVKDPKRYGYTDMYGRVFGWLYIDGKPFVRPETQYPRR